MPEPTATTEKKVEERAPGEDGVIQRDLDWLKNVYRGTSEPQLTARAVISGMIFGGIMSVSNLYIGLKSGWGLGVDIAAIIIMFALFKGLKSMGIVRKEFGMMESTIMMTAAVAASWISSAGLVSAIPALTMLTGYQFVWWQLCLLIGIILYGGLFMAIPFKRQMIQVDHLRFPGNVPTGETLKAMYSAGGDAMKKAKALFLAGASGIILVVFRDILAPMFTFIGVWMRPLYSLPGVRIKGVPLSKLTLSFEPSFIFIGIGALMGIKVGMSMLVGFLFNYAVLAPNLIDARIIKHAPPQVNAVALMQTPVSVPAGQQFVLAVEEASKSPVLDDGARVDTFRYTWLQPATYASTAELEHAFNAPTLNDGATPNPLYGIISVRDTLSKELKAPAMFVEASKFNTWESKLTLAQNQDTTFLKSLGFAAGTANMKTVGGFRNISAWSLWPGATVLVVGGLLALAFQWRTLGRTFGSIFSSFSKKKNGKKGPLDDIEIPMSWFVPGFLVTGLASIIILMWMFHIHWYMGAIAVLLTFFLAAVAARAGAEIGINPIGALGKVTQLTFGAIAPGNVTANLMTASVTAGAAASCSDTIGNLFVGHMVGAHPRKQFIAQLFGVISGALMAVPMYFLLVPDASTLGGDKFPAPSALVWMGVAKVLAKGLSTIPPSAVYGIIIAFILGVTIVILDRVFPKIKPYTPSPAALGIAMTINGYTSFSMFLGAAIVWILERKAPKWNDMNTVPIASGWIAGESIAGVIVVILLYFNILQ